MALTKGRWPAAARSHGQRCWHETQSRSRCRVYQPFASADSTFRLLELVQHAPSVFNTQPWWFRIRADDRIDLCARIGTGSAYRHLQEHGLELTDGDRRLPSVDPESRELVMSCGAALFNLWLSIRVAGHDLAIQLQPYPQDKSVLATVEIVTSRIHPPTSTQQELYDSILRRHTDRWPYARAGRRPRRADPVPPNILAAMELAAARHEGRLRVLNRAEANRWLREADQADRELRSSGKYLTELSRWTDDGESDIGIPPDAFGPAWENRGHLRKGYPPIRDFGAHAAPAGRAGEGRDEGAGEDPGPSERPVRRFERFPQLMLLSTSHNESLDWLRAGQALQDALLTATRYGVSASFLTQPFEAQDHNAQRESPSWGRRPAPLESAEVAPGPVAAAHDGLRLLPPARRDPALRRQRQQRTFPEYPQLVLRVGYATHDPFITRREDPKVLDCRCDPPSWLPRAAAATS